ncbi:MAG: TIGR03862 family flavoprotein [Pseudomonadota bacterium]
MRVGTRGARLNIKQIQAAVIGAGPAGLAAAEVLVNAGIAPVVFEAKPSPARKFLMAGKSGLNLTKDEEEDTFRAAFNCPQMEPALGAFGSGATQDWARDLGEVIFKGSSRRVFPKAMKGSPLLRKWLARLEAGGARLRTRSRWTGWEGDFLSFDEPNGLRLVEAQTTILALGGASWARLGSDGVWADLLSASGMRVTPFRPANMGFERPWSEHFKTRFAGAPVKSAALSLAGETQRGEFVVSEHGVEGSLIYTLSAKIRDHLITGPVTLALDLYPDRHVDELVKQLSRPRGKATLSNHLRKMISLTGVRAALVRELAPEALSGPEALAIALKALPLQVDRPRPMDEAISTAGGLSWDALTPDLMLRQRPGTFAAGEMLDWEAPTGGYLITGCLATGRWAGRSAANWLEGKAIRGQGPEEKGAYA